MFEGTVVVGDAAHAQVVGEEKQESGTGEPQEKIDGSSAGHCTRWGSPAENSHFVAGWQMRETS